MTVLPGTFSNKRLSWSWNAGASVRISPCQPNTGLLGLQPASVEGLHATGKGFNFRSDNHTLLRNSYSVSHDLVAALKADLAFQSSRAFSPAPAPGFGGFAPG